MDTTAEPTHAAEGRWGSLVLALGIAQIISWGTLFYAIGVLAEPVRKDLGLSDTYIFGSFTVSLFLSGTVAPTIGRMVDRRGGRIVLAGGSVISALSMGLLAAATGPVLFVIAWLVGGIAMAAGLYDAAFATLSKHCGTQYRRAVTMLTLLGGLASTAFWPLSHLLMETVGWRGAFLIFAALHLCVCLPLHLIFVPRGHRGSAGEDRAVVAAAAAAQSNAVKHPRLFWLASSLALATFTFSALAVHMIRLLDSAGLTAGQAVGIAMLVGPMQIVGRIVELGIARHVRSVTIGMVALSLMLLSLVALGEVEGLGAAAIVFVVAYGCGNGLLTVVRGTVPGELFGLEALGGLLGRLARASLYARAVAPASLPIMLSLGHSRAGMLTALGGIGILAVFTYAMAVRQAGTTGTVPPLR